MMSKVAAAAVVIMVVQLVVLAAAAATPPPATLRTETSDLPSRLGVRRLLQGCVGECEF